MDLQTKLSSLSTALRTQDVSTALRVQRELLAAGDQADAALKNDKSTQAQKVKAAIADIRAAAAGGDNNGYDRAASTLRQVLGGATSGLGLSVANPPAAGDAATDLHTLSDQVRGLNQAMQSHNTGEALRLQAQLVNAVATAQKSAERDDSDQGKALRAALSDLQKGLDGDATRLGAASAALDKLSGPPQTAGKPVATDASQMAASLASRVDAFRAAASTNSKADLLRLQQEILVEVDQDSAALALVAGADPSPSAAALKAGLDGVRAGVSGDLTKLDGARANLAKAAGYDSSVSASASAGAATGGTPSGKPIADLGRFAADMDNTVNSFQAAFQKNDTDAMLRLQRQLSDQATQVDSSLKDAQSKPADEVRAAVASIRTAFAGDLNKLDEAHLHLRTVTGAASGGTSAVSSNTPSTQPRLAQPSSTPPAGDVTIVANGLRDKVTGLSVAVRDHQSADELAKRRDALKAEVTQAEAALGGLKNDPRADRLRNALGAAREAAGGDDTKVASAQSALEAALQLNGQ
jgi:hypothetical protein